MIIVKIAKIEYVFSDNILIFIMKNPSKRDLLLSCFYGEVTTLALSLIFFLLLEVHPYFLTIEHE
jgi:hypothetical protein